MPRRLRPILCAALLLLGGCGLFGDSPSETAAPDATASTATGGAAGASAGTGTTASDIGGTTAPETEPAAGGAAAAAAPASDQVSGGAAAPAAASTAATAPTQQLTIDERIERLLESQEALTQRLDSLTAEIAPEEGAGGRADSGEVLGQAGQEVRNFGVGVVLSIVVLILFNLTIRGLVWLLDALAERSASRRLFYKRLVPIVRIVLWVFAAYLIVRVIFQVDYQGLVAAAAAIGVAVGFAAQDLLKNLFGGLILVFDQPFQVGDKITVGDTYGEVVSIGLRSTRMVTPDDNRVSVPNAEVVDKQVANANAGELNCQVVTDLYLPGWADEVEAKRIAFEAAASSKYVYLNKPIVTLVSDVFKETFLTRVRVKAYVLDPRLEFVFQSDVTERARAGFREAGLLRPEHMRLRLVERSAAGVGVDDAPDPDRDAED
ncbi:MAG: mechanosensitive ion channel [Gemmatimonadota bacterium]